MAAVKSSLLELVSSGHGWDARDAMNIIAINMIILQFECDVNGSYLLMFAIQK